MEKITFCSSAAIVASFSGAVSGPISDIPICIEVRIVPPAIRSRAGATLTAGEGYWILAYGPAGAPTCDWKASSPAELPTGLATHLGALWGTGGPPPTGSSSIVCSYSVTATLVPVELQSFTIE